MADAAVNIVRLGAASSDGLQRPPLAPDARLCCPLDRDVFVLKDPARWFFFAPRSRAYCAVHPEVGAAIVAFEEGRALADVVREFGLEGDLGPAVAALVQAGILQVVGAMRPIGAPRTSRARPTPAMFMIPTNDCNLRCRYCYAGAGDWTPHDMDNGLVTAAIEAFVREHLDHANELLLVFHGGGEPTARLALFQRIIDEFERACRGVMITPQFSLVTNACFGPDARALIVAHRFRVQVSLDGLADVQDVQRPMANGTGSFAPLIANVRYLVAHGVPVTFRTTVTRLSVDSLEAMVRLAAELGVARVHFEPMFRTGRGLDDDLGPPDHDAYADALQAAFLLGQTLGVRVEASDLLALLPPRGTFCGACGANVIVAPSGRISTCAHVLDPADEAAETFLVGEVNRQDADFAYLPGRRERLQHRTVDHMAECRDCYLRLNCAGDCPIRAFRVNDGDIFRTRPAACESRRRTNAWAIAWVARGGVPLGETATSARFSLAARTRLSS